MAAVIVPLRATVLIDRPRPEIAAALLRRDLVQRTAHTLGWVAEQVPAGDRHHPGAVIRIRRGHRAAQWTVDLDEAGLPVFTARATAHRPAWLLGARVHFDLAPTAAGTLVTAEFRGRPTAARVLPGYRRRVLDTLQQFLGILTLALHETRWVVAAALVAEGKVLAARRTRPPELAGFWELPGGKVEPGESHAVALAREIGEEFGVVIDVGDPVGPPVPLATELAMQTYAATIVEGEPVPIEHDQVRWLPMAELDQVPWLPADEVLLPHLARLLADQASGQAV